MNLRKTIAGAAVALGGAAVMLGLGSGTASAAGADLQSAPDLDTELGKVGGVDDIAAIDTTDGAGKIKFLNLQNPNAKAVVTNLDGQTVSSLLGYDNSAAPSDVDLGADI
ncbi:hypothetical protein FHS29_005375 [Saccharothrix tamanrassetensis]|uniref:Secreted protein n=1 Tax=Saccharothrix tamanrassetensis TaxID=1051531 RepID=A0A841CTL1_9PSEU|nr:hypothetical protein [Saccharothrix tamanrassetensis]MBB5958766.1 hypothetical protein [Saccharothrix tamanrassetensis]